jgi:hypothetical protein
VVSFATVLDWRGFEGTCYGAAEEQDFRPIDEYEPIIDGWADLLLSTAGHYLPNLNNPPWYVSYPCTQNGQAISVLWDHVDVQTARGVAESLDVADLDLTIGVFAAVGDQFGSDLSAQRFSDVLVAQQAAHTLRIFETDAQDPHADLRFGMVFSFLHPMPADTWVVPTVWQSAMVDTVSVHMELPDSLDLAEVDLESLVLSAVDGHQLYEPVPASASIVGDAVEATIDSAKARSAVWPFASESSRTVEITIRGEMTDGRFFAGTETVRMLRLPELPEDTQPRDLD